MSSDENCEKRSSALTYFLHYFVFVVLFSVKKMAFVKEMCSFRTKVLDMMYAWQ